MRPLLILLGLTAGLTVEGHEIGTTRVSALLQDGQKYAIEVVTDATALGEKMEIPLSGPAFTELFLTRVKVAFDGIAVRPEVECTVTPAPDATSAPAATIRLTGTIPPGARDFTWSFGWTFTSYSLSVRHAPSESPATRWLEGKQVSEAFAVAGGPLGAVDRGQTIWRYLTLGFTHILPLGLDHVLFVLGIYLLSGRARAVLWQVSAFTLAHSITLGLTMYGVMSVSPRIVEPMIALSIAYVAIENLVHAELRSWRIALVFAFGLLHGMGFAGVLQELGLPRSEFLTALLAFNVGVEAGQLAVIGAAFLLVGWRWSERSWYRSRIAVPASSVIACTAVYWTIERLLS